MKEIFERFLVLNTNDGSYQECCDNEEISSAISELVDDEGISPDDIAVVSIDAIINFHTATKVVIETE